MTYRQGFDHLGNPVPQPTATPASDWQHKLIRRAAWTVVVVCLGIMLWGR